MAAFTERRDGQTAIGTANQKSFLAVNSAPGTAGVYVFVDSAGVEWFFWVDTSGNLRRASAEPTNYQSDGTVVGP